MYIDLPIYKFINPRPRVKNKKIESSNTEIEIPQV